MEEFFSQVEKIKGMLDKAISIAADGVADDIDLTTLKNDAEALANKCFAVGKMSPVQSVARKDAYDFVVACSRLGDVVGMTRADYYIKAANDLPTCKERVEYSKVAVINLESSGGA